MPGLCGHTGSLGLPEEPENGRKSNMKRGTEIGWGKERFRLWNA